MTRLSVPLWHTSDRQGDTARPIRPGSPYLAQIIRDCLAGPAAADDSKRTAAYAQRKKGAPERHARTLDKTI